MPLKIIEIFVVKVRYDICRRNLPLLIIPTIPSWVEKSWVEWG